MEKEEIHCKISGRVQLVMFRDFATRKARRLGLTGYVCNEPDGTVEVVAQGPHADLEAFIRHLSRGSMLSHVTAVDVEWRKPVEIFDSFTLVR